jgi:nucleoside-diphosphate-sugar epimerase
MLVPPSVAVTGASGFLGRYVCERLVARGRPVRGLVRTAASPLPAGVQPVVIPDYRDRAALRTALAGAQAVIHLAARVHVMRDASVDPLADYRAVNVELTGTLLDEAIAAGVGTFIFASSIKAVGESTDTRWTDDVTPDPADPYGVSKLEAEQLILRRAAGTSTHVHILRLPLVYGAGMKGNMLRLFELVDRGWPLPFGLIDNRRTLVYAGNVAAAFEAVLDYDKTLSAGPFFLGDARDVSTPELIREIASVLGRPARLMPVPPAFIRALGRMGDTLSRIAPSPFRTVHADRLLGSLALDASGFARAVNFRPPFSLRDGLADAARWYRSMKQVSPTSTAAAPAGEALER